MSFFKRITTDAVSFKEKKKKKEPKTKFKSEDPESGNCKKEGTSLSFKDCTNIHLGPSFSFSNTNIINNGVPKATNSEYEETTPTIPKDIEENFSSIKKPTMYHFDLVSHHVKNGCKQLGLQLLCFTENELEKYPAGEQGILKLLLDWQRAKTNEATIGRLLKSLWDAQEYEAARRLSDDILSNPDSM